MFRVSDFFLQHEMVCTPSMLETIDFWYNEREDTAKIISFSSSEFKEIVFSEAVEYDIGLPPLPSLPLPYGKEEEEKEEEPPVSLKTFSPLHFSSKHVNAPIEDEDMQEEKEEEEEIITKPTFSVSPPPPSSSFSRTPSSFYDFMGSKAVSEYLWDLISRSVSKDKNTLSFVANHYETYVTPCLSRQSKWKGRDVEKELYELAKNRVENGGMNEAMAIEQSNKRFHRQSRQLHQTFLLQRNKKRSMEKQQQQEEEMYVEDVDNTYYNEYKEQSQQVEREQEKKREEESSSEDDSEDSDSEDSYDDEKEVSGYYTYT